MDWLCKLTGNYHKLCFERNKIKAVTKFIKIYDKRNIYTIELLIIKLLKL